MSKFTFKPPIGGAYTGAVRSYASHTLSSGGASNMADLFAFKYMLKTENQIASVFELFELSLLGVSILICLKK